jgi:phosphoserine aminotransferase
MLPLPVLERAAAEMTNARGSGQSVMEMSHRSSDFVPIIENAERLLRKLLAVPDDYTVLFLQGGAWTQFSMVPLNLAGVESGAPLKNAAYVDTGIWAAKAADEAKKYARVRVAASSRAAGYTNIPPVPPPSGDEAYWYICLNNTIMGTRWPALPDTGSVPLVADISSCIAAWPIDVRRFGLLFAGAQKNLGPAGCTVVIVRDDLLGKAPSWTPRMLRYDTHAAEKSLFNTPPCFCVYMMGLTLEWLDESGGVEAAFARNREKARLLYDYLDATPEYAAPVEKDCRSLVNVRFGINVSSAERRLLLERRFVEEAHAAGLVNLAGHRLAGGLRASIYNAMPLEGVRALIGFMEAFKPAIKACASGGAENHVSD